MRIALVLAAVVALVATLWFVLDTDAADVSIVPEPVAPRVESAPFAAELEQPVFERETDRAADAHARVDPTPASSGGAIVLRVRVFGPDREAMPGDVGLEIRDALARSIPYAESGVGVHEAVIDEPGTYTVAAALSHHLPIVEHVDVRADEGPRTIDLRFALAPRARVRWQTPEGEPFLRALASSRAFDRVADVRVAADDEARAIGAAAPNSATVFRTTIDPKQPPSAHTPWPGAPADAVAEVALASAPPGFVVATLDGCVIASARVDDPSVEVVLRTSVAVAQGMRAALRCCVAHGETGAPVANARIRAVASNGAVREFATGIDGCLADAQLTAGTWRVAFEAPGRASVHRVVVLAPGADLDLGTVRFERARSIVVRAEHVDGTPAPATPLVLRPAVSDGDGDSHASRSTDPTGTARFATTSTERMLVAVDDARYAATARFVDPSASSVTITVEPGVPVALRFAPPRAVNARMVVHDAQGFALCSKSVPTSGLVPLRLLAGEYVVEIEGASNARGIVVERDSAVFDLR